MNVKEKSAADKRKKVLFDVYDWIETIVISIVIVALIFTFAFRVVNVDGNSMNNTLMNSDKVIITNVFYKPKAGDIVIIARSDAYEENQEKEPLIKRVIATEGQTVMIDFDEGVVYIDGEAIADEYVKEPTYRKGDIEFPVVVPENCVFVLGDNRNDSKDSRFSEIGMISIDKILGKALFRIYPFNEIKSLI
ncbi:MAG: signal peptidase I [Acutalibacteraceae bacterium]